MPYATAADGVKLYFEETGAGTPVVFVHEYAGDEDEACIDGSVMLKRTVPTAALMVIPRAGHTINSEEPAAFNQALLEFFSAVENRRWMAHRKMTLDE